jgi:hypothetical protein
MKDFAHAWHKTSLQTDSRSQIPPAVAGAVVHFWITKTSTDLQMYGYPTKVREEAVRQSSSGIVRGKGQKGASPLN